MPNPETSADSPNLDILRCVAVLCVFVFHLARLLGVDHLTRPPIYSLGHWGVLMFFVHTSLVLMRSLARSEATPGIHRLYLNFMVRRVFRLFPLCWTMVLVIFFLRLPVGHMDRGGHFHAVSMSFSGALANLFLVQNLAHVESFEAPLWSLPFEMQMYLVLPLVYLLTRWRANLTVIVAAWMLWCALVWTWPASSAYDMRNFVPCFMAGVISFKMPGLRRRLPSALWLPMILITTLVYLSRPTTSVGWVCCLLLAGSIPQFEQVRHGLTKRAALLIARYSYGIYLVHFVVLWFIFDRLGMTGVSGIVLYSALTAAIAALLYHSIEAPGIGAGRLLVGWYGRWTLG